MSQEEEKKNKPISKTTQFLAVKNQTLCCVFVILTVIEMETRVKGIENESKSNYGKLCLILVSFICQLI